MTRIVFAAAMIAAVLGSLFFTSRDAMADDAVVATKLEAVGGTVVMQNGVATQLSFRNCSKLGEAEFRAIGELTQLKNLTLYGGCKGLTDETLPLLAALKQLETIGTDGLWVTDDGLKHFAQFANLKAASFFHTSFRKEGFTGVGFGHLKACPKLEKLTVAGISMGDDAFAAIATIDTLRDFSTWHTYQTEAGNTCIARLTNLKSLRIGQRLPWDGGKEPSLTDASLPTFLALKNLEVLQIGESKFTLEALVALKALPKLKALKLFETDIAADDVEKLRAALPGIKVEWEPLTDEQRKRLDMYLRR